MTENAVAFENTRKWLQAMSTDELVRTLGGACREYSESEPQFGDDRSGSARVIEVACTILGPRLNLERFVRPPQEA